MSLRLILVRHGESVDNVAGLLAGSRDAPLTSHGVLQARRLGSHLAARSADIGPVRQVWASNLSRAAKTAEAIAKAQSESGNITPEVVQRPELREKDFGSDEGVRYGSKRPNPVGAGPSDCGPAPPFIAHESQEAMWARIQRFVEQNLVPGLAIASTIGDGTTSQKGAVVVVAHGIILNVLLRFLLTRWGPDELTKLPAAAGPEPWRRDWLAVWSNTGYLESEVRIANAAVVVDSYTQKRSAAFKKTTGDYPMPSGCADGLQVAKDTPHSQPSASTTPSHIPVDIQLSVKRVNYVEHLAGLKKTRGGIGSAGFDEKQKTVDSFFSRPAKKARRDEQGDD